MYNAYLFYYMLFTFLLCPKIEKMRKNVGPKTIFPTSRVPAAKEWQFSIFFFTEVQQPKTLKNECSFFLLPKYFF